MAGPDLLNSLVEVILWFCNYKFAFSTDIEAMYDQAGVNSDDADALRFIWLGDVNSDETWQPDTYHRCWYTSLEEKILLPVQIIRSQKNSRDHGNKYNEAVAECVNRFFYMDDLLKSVETEEQSGSIIKQLIESMQIGRFNLTKFQSNVKVLK